MIFSAFRTRPFSLDSIFEYFRVMNAAGFPKVALLRLFSRNSPAFIPVRPPLIVSPLRHTSASAIAAIISLISLIALLSPTRLDVTS